MNAGQHRVCMVEHASMASPRTTAHVPKDSMVIFFSLFSHAMPCISLCEKHDPGACKESRLPHLILFIHSQVSTVRRIWMNVYQVHVRMVAHATIETMAMFAHVHQDMLELTANRIWPCAIQVIK